ncbi:type VI secretion system-associated protein TagF [Mesorhizobium sp. AR07]|uniref:type VI secretion system-associated protein TagF n=1 Tax=Mesorhizobium sp. AR07 TaxID=2865838 RepID=UPI00215F335E|nr:type VI secretion system-associated protein TagF [Mesorhizobium sp. AR07]UVK44057.1 type VI secretion system-associated protein TagF [Mesorhizobium sp. AR07]
MTPGFFGKIPATGDFVSRGLAAEFTRRWDDWLARHLAPWEIANAWPGHLAIRFLIGPGMLGPAAGIFVPSMDRAGRQFPLAISVPLPFVATSFAYSAAGWFEQVINAAFAARGGQLNADELAAELIALPFPMPEQMGDPVEKMVLWIVSEDLIEVEPDAPRAALENLLSSGSEAG